MAGSGYCLKMFHASWEKSALVLRVFLCTATGKIESFFLNSLPSLISSFPTILQHSDQFISISLDTVFTLLFPSIWFHLFLPL